jgi:hypothetical protein
VITLFSEKKRLANLWNKHHVNQKGLYLKNRVQIIEDCATLNSTLKKLL